MLRITKILLCFLFLGQIAVTAQENNPISDHQELRVAEHEISALAKQIHSDTSLENRRYAAKRVGELLEAALLIDSSYSYDFAALEGISLLQPADKAFRIFTWEMYENQRSYIQFGIIQTAEGKHFVLKDQSKEMRTPEFGRNRHDNWYGALYYNIKAFKTNNKTQYLLFGRDSYSLFEHRKVLDVLYFDNNGKPRFGNNILSIKDGRGRMRVVNRFLLQYSAGVYVKLNYDEELKMVVYDHLISGQGVIKKEGPTGVPDGSYCGMQLVKGRWEYVDKVYKDDPNNVLVNDQSPFIIMNRTPKKRENDLKKMFGNSSRKKKKK